MLMVSREDNLGEVYDRLLFLPTITSNCGAVHSLLIFPVEQSPALHRGVTVPGAWDEYPR